MLEPRLICDRDRAGFGRLTSACAAIAIPLVVVSAPVSAQELRAWDHGDYGRAVFEWGQAVDHRLDQSGTTLDLTFSEPLSADFDTVPPSLTSYVQSMSPIGTETLRLLLSQSADATAFGTGTAVILDIRPTGGNADANDTASPNPGLSMIAPSGNAMPGNAGAIPRPEPAEQRQTAPEMAAVDETVSAPRDDSLESAETQSADSASLPTQAVRVRGGMHDAYDRLVFDWPQPTAFTVHQDGQQARISFERSARLDQSGLQEQTLDRLRSVTPNDGGSGLVVDLELSPNTRIDSFTIDDRAVFDIRDGTPRSDEIPDLPSVAESSGDPQLADSGDGQADDGQADGDAIPQPTPLLAPEADPEPSADSATDLATGDEGPAFRPRPSPPRPSPPASPSPDVAASSAPDAQEGPGDDQPDPIPPRPAAPDTQTADQPAAEALSAIDGDDDLPSLEEVSSSIEETLSQLESGGGRQGRSRPDREEEAGGQTAASARSGYGTVPRESLEVRTLDVPEGPVIEFDPGVTAYASFFLRDGALWAVFASQNRLNVSDLARDGERVLGPPETVDATGGVALRFADVGASGLYVRRDNTAWSVTLVDDYRSAEVPISLLRQPNHPDGGRVLAMAPGARGVVRLQDPDIGDVLLVAPVAQAGVGMPTTREFAQLEFLRAATGIAVRPKADDILMTLTPDGVALTADSGLVLSPDVDTRLAAASRPGEGVPRFFDFDDWTLPDRSFTEQRRELERRVVESQDDERASVRMELARLSLAHALPHEAIGMLTLAADARPEIVQDPEFLALRGAARALVGNLDGAAADLNDDAFVNAAEGYVWRGLVDERRGNYEDATRAFSRAGDVWSEFPDDLQIELRMSAARAALLNGEIEAGHRIANDLLDDYDSRVSDTGAFQYLTGLIAKNRGDGDRAVAWFGEAVDNSDRKYAVLSERELVALQVEREEIEPQDAARRLEQLRFAWRGDHLEFELLEDLGEAYWRDGSIRQALVTWDDATQEFSELPGAERLADQLRSRFVQIFVGEDGAAANVDPIARYSLYEDFQHLVPAGETGRDIRLRLAEGLAEIDLLGRSASMLEDILTDGLPADEVAEVATRLAGLRLLDNRVEDALDATDLALQSDPSPETAEQARALRARALSEIDRSTEAFQTIAEDEGDLADATRLDIAWRARDWGRAADALWSLVDRSDLDGRSLDAEWRNRLMNLTLVLALSDDEDGLREVTERFGDRLSNGPEGEAFRVLTRTGGAMDSLNLQSIRNEVDEVDLFQSFLESFRQPDDSDAGPGTAMN